MYDAFSLAELQFGLSGEIKAWRNSLFSMGLEMTCLPAPDWSEISNQMAAFEATRLLAPDWSVYLNLIWFEFDWSFHQQFFTAHFDKQIPLTNQIQIYRPISSKEAGLLLMQPFDSKLWTNQELWGGLIQMQPFDWIRISNPPQLGLEVLCNVCEGVWPQTQKSTFIVMT